jgi:uncharacterized protein YndB with AHSA1/START domain
VIEVDRGISAVRRQVGARVVEAGEARTVTISRTYDTDIGDLWDACTNPERIPRWFLPVSGDLRVGGHYQLEGNAGGTVQTCDRPHGFTATWEHAGVVSWIAIRLAAESESRTRFELEHTMLADDDTWARFGPGAVGVGWDLAVLGLGLHVATQSDVDAGAFMAWSASDEGTTYMTACSAGWGEADIEAGADRADAERMATATAGFYTGSP